MYIFSCYIWQYIILVDINFFQCNLLPNFVFNDNSLANKL